MKTFKKKHDYLPSQATIVRMLRHEGGAALASKYLRIFARTPALIPEPIRVVCLAEFDPGKRTNIRYYSDLHNFKLYDEPNRSLPIPKFLNMFRTLLDNEKLNQVEHDLTAYRLEFYTTPEDWVRVYQDGNVHSCMTNNGLVRCYAHPENKLALAALYPPGGNQVIARSIVNVEDKWYVRLFGDNMLVTKLNELGYSRITRAPKEFKMYGQVGRNYQPGLMDLPYFDFPVNRTDVVPGTHNPETGLIEIVINPGINA